MHFKNYYCFFCSNISFSSISLPKSTCFFKNYIACGYYILLGSVFLLYISYCYSFCSGTSFSSISLPKSIYFLKSYAAYSYYIFLGSILLLYMFFQLFYSSPNMHVYFLRYKPYGFYALSISVLFK